MKAVDPQQANMAFTGSACENVHMRALCDDEGRGKVVGLTAADCRALTNSHHPPRQLGIHTTVNVNTSRCVPRQTSFAFSNSGHTRRGNRGESLTE